MFLFIARYEWLALKANKMLLLLAAITTSIVFFALFEGAQRVTFQKRVLKEIVQQEEADYKKYRTQIAAANSGQHFDGGHFGDPTNPFYFGNRMGAKYAALPPQPLAILSSGQSDMFPYYYKITLSKKQALYHNEELENPQILFNGRFDVSFVIIFLLPLLIIGFTYNIYSSEKEAGTLTLLLAQNTSIDKLMQHRFLFRYLLFNLFFTSLLFVGLMFFDVNIYNSGNTLLGITGFTWVYTAFWFALSYWINSLKKTSHFAATTLTGSWLLLVLVMPTFISAVTDAVHPLPSRLDLITQTRNISDSIAKSGNALNRFLDEHPEFKPATADPKDRNPSTLRNRIEVELAMEKTRMSFDAVVQKREKLINNYRFLSPALFMQQAFNKASGNDDNRYKNFSAEVTHYQQNFRRHFEPLIYKQQKFTTVHLDGVPQFTSDIGLTPVFDKNGLTDIFYLSFITALILFVANIKARRKNKEQQKTSNGDHSLSKNQYKATRAIKMEKGKTTYFL